MNKLILHPTETCQWYALINEAQDITQFILNESTESYLVFLLMRFTQETHFADSIIALDFLQAMQTTGRRQIALLKEVGDKSLLVSGLFPDLAKGRQLNVQYFVDLGQSAYWSIGCSPKADSPDLFQQLGEEFSKLQGILQAMRTTHWNVAKHSPIVSVLDSPKSIS